MMEFTFNCPHCNCEYDGLDFLDSGDMDGTFTVECECNNSFTVDFSTTITFETHK